ncbi:MAG: GrpB family protein [Thermomicrobiales bacterium]
MPDATPGLQRNRPQEIMTEADIRTATVGEPTRVDSTIVLAEYDPEWPARYEREAAKIRTALGDRVVGLEHIGSTSVPGLCAKPIIDIQLLVEDSSDETSYVDALTAAGYTLRIREPEWEEHRVFKGAGPDVNLHVFSRGSRQAERHLRFRDAIRANDTDRDRYAATKRELAAQTWAYVQNYADAKNGVIDEILARAGNTIPRE